MWYFIIYTAIVATCFCYIRTGKNYNLSLALKTLASMGFIGLAIFTPIINDSRFTLSNAFLIMGAICGLLGDIILDVYYSQNNSKHLFMGFACFGVGHIFYLFSILNIATSSGSIIKISVFIYTIILALIISITFILGCRILKLDFGNMSITTNIYTYILCFITIFSWIVTTINSKFLTMSIGFTLFLVSDCILSFIYFGKKRKSNLFQILNHSLYYLAQILICITLFNNF